ncbi:MAG TPA: hypothetical protein PKK00_10565 [Bacteroidales bacterium]|nr:hypothetical protein [Bacteroidales bacterium]HPS17766.1 hypothetical protein [Bacteroidales bacterium]
MKKRIYFIFIILITLFACKKQVDKERPEFIGLWHACVDGGCTYFVHLSIDEYSHANYMIYWQGKDIEHGGIAKANDHFLKLKDVFYFKIIEYPHPIDTTIEKYYVYDYNDGKTKLANWKMILNGPKPSALYVSGKWTYYKADY